MDVTKHEPGMFSWADLGTPDFAGSKQFYTAFLDLEANVMSLPNGVEFCMMQKRGKNVFSIYTMPEEMKQMTGGRPVWQSYFTVESAEDASAAIKKLGGTVAQEPVDVMDAGRLLVAQDPTGAAFSVWQPLNQIGAEVFGEPGAPGVERTLYPRHRSRRPVLHKPLRLVGGEDAERRRRRVQSV